MAETLLITKKSTKTWLHQPSDDLQFIIGKFTFSIDGDFFQIVELGQSKRNKYNFADITVYDETTSATYDSFTSIVDLSTTLETLGYPAFLRDGDATGVISVNGLTGVVVVDGDNIDVTDPTTSTDATLNDALANIYASGGTPDLQAVTDVGNETTNGIGAQSLIIYGGDPYRDLTDPEMAIVSSSATGLNSVAFIFQDNAIEFRRSKSEFGSQYNLRGSGGGVADIAFLSDITGGGGYTVVNANLTAVNDTNYTVVANATFTDPTPTEGKGYVVYVRNGTATIGGTGYAVGGLVFRVYHSGSWSTREYKSNLTLDATPTDGSTNGVESNGVFDALATKVNASRFIHNGEISITGTSTESNICSFKIAGGAYSANDGFKLDATFIKGVTSGGITYRVYFGTTSGARTNQIAQASVTNTGRASDFTRRYYINSGQLNTAVGFTANASSGLGSQNVANTPISIDTASDVWITITAQGQTSGETVGVLGASITPLK